MAILRFTAPPGRNAGQRGPQEFQVDQEPRPDAPSVLFPELLGGVVRIARESSGGSVRGIARLAEVAPSQIVALEKGEVAITAFHLDHLAYVYNVAISGKEREETPSIWRGWQLFHVATLISDSLKIGGYIVFWSSPRRPLPPGQFTRGEDLYELIRARWPEIYADRLTLDR